MRLSTYLDKALIGIRGSLWSLCFPLRQRKYAQKKVIACVFSLGERSEESCIESITNQGYPIQRIEVIKHVTPMHEAFNRMFDIAFDADYILCVDADMVLDPKCTYELMRLTRPDVLYSLAPLTDPVLGRVGYIKLLNMDLVRKHKLRFRNVFGCDVDFNRQAQEQDPSIRIESYTIMRKPLGIHRPTYTAKELFRKNQIEKKKRGSKINARLLRSMIEKYNETGNLVLLAGILGELLPNPDRSPGESSPSSGLDNWYKVRELVGSIPDDLEYGFDLKKK